MTIRESLSLDFRAFADGLSIPVCLLSREGVVLSLNRLAAGLFGFADKPETPVGRRLSEFCDDPPAVDEMMRRWARSNQRTPGFLKVIYAPGKPVECRCSGMAIGSGGTEASFILLECLPKDRHPGRFAELNKQLEELRAELAKRAQLAVERTRLLEAEQQARMEAERAIVQKDEFLGMMSHELRTPITTIYGNAFLLRNHPDALGEEDRAEAMADIYNEADRLRRIIENLLVLARVDTSRSPAPEMVSLQEKLETIAEEFRRSHPERELRLSVLSGLPSLNLVPAYIEMIVSNLLSNAAKYSPPEAPIDLILRRGEGEVVVSVLDEGVGLQPDEITSVFEPFFRSPRTQELAGGVGLGLSVCKRLAEVQGGNLTASPRAERGTDFSLTLPL